MLDLRTPSSPHSTSWWTTSATPARKKSGFPGLMPRSAPARWSPSPSSPDGAASEQRAGLLPLRNGLLAGRFPYPAQPLLKFNRLVRSCVGLIEEVALHLEAVMGAQSCQIGRASCRERV